MNPDDDEDLAWLWKFRQELAERHRGDPYSLLRELRENLRVSGRPAIDLSERAQSVAARRPADQLFDADVATHPISN